MQPVQPVQPVEPVQPVQPVYADRRVRYTEPPRQGVWRAANLVYIIFGVIETLILLRFILKLLAANPAAGFSSFIYNITAPLVAPFQGVFPTPTSNGSVVEVAALLAIVVYALIAWVIVRLIGLAQRGPTYTA